MNFIPVIIQLFWKPSYICISNLDLDLHNIISTVE